MRLAPKPQTLPHQAPATQHPSIEALGEAREHLLAAQALLGKVEELQPPLAAESIPQILPMSWRINLNAWQARIESALASQNALTRQVKTIRAKRS
jgi:hypothetical protein